MKDSHAHLAITEAEWQVFLADFRACLESFSVPKQAQSELFAIVESTKNDIVQPDHSKTDPSKSSQ